MTLHAVVIAAGLGTRLRPLTEHYAKPVLPIDGKPVIALLLRELAEAGIDAATIVIGHLAEQVERLVGDGSGFGLADSLRKTSLARWLCRRRTRGGTGGAVPRSRCGQALHARRRRPFRHGIRRLRRRGRDRRRGTARHRPDPRRIRRARARSGPCRRAAVGDRAWGGRARGDASRQASLRARASVSTCDRRGRACSGDPDRPDARSDGAGRRPRGELPLPEDL